MKSTTSFAFQNYSLPCVQFAEGTKEKKREENDTKNRDRYANDFSLVCV